jgi:glyoxylase-like metal-dependent hydrolase (beta-lactamase superfamily II)
MEQLAAGHKNRIEELEHGLQGIGSTPSFAIGQRALLADGVLWDCVTLLDDETAERVGQLDAIAISHPHYYAAMIEWAERFDAVVLLHEADREHVMRPSERIEFWTGERRRIGATHELVRLGGHFAGGTVCLWNGALLSGDIVQVVPDQGWFSFMYSYPNYIPLPAAEVDRMRHVLETLEFDRVYGAFWDRVVLEDAKAGVLRSADRYLAALAGELP